MCRSCPISFHLKGTLIHLKNCLTFVYKLFYVPDHVRAACISSGFSAICGFGVFRRGTGGFATGPNPGEGVAETAGAWASETAGLSDRSGGVVCIRRVERGGFSEGGSVSEPAQGGELTPVLQLCAKWASEKPKRAVDIVWGPYSGGWFIAICKKTQSDLGWKSIGFVIPSEGILEGKLIWDYSRSVNWIEHQIGYNLFPKLPAHMQEIIEEMTATEHLCPNSEFDPGLEEGADGEIDYDWEADYRDMG